MLVIVADTLDADAAALAHRWRDHDAAVMSVGDVVSAGWCHRVGAAGAATAVVGGSVVDVATISGVLTLLPCIAAQRLAQIIPEDRGYVAAETTAFLASWLTDLTCPVMNRPRPIWLTGPNWRPAQWVHAAAQLGIPVRPMRRRVALDGESGPASLEPRPTTLTVVAGRCFGEADATLQEHAIRLAAAAGVTLLAVHFESPRADARLIGADLRPDIVSPGIADAMLGYLSGSGTC